MRKGLVRLVGFFVVIVFLLIVVLANADWIDGVPIKCNSARRILDLCK